MSPTSTPTSTSTSTLATATATATAIMPAPAPEVAAFAGVRRRVAAFMVDSLVLGVVGWALGLALFDVFVRMGPWGRCVGFVVALAYFVGQESAPGGQSPGKRLLRIRVVDAQGRSLRPARGAVRFAVLGVPWFLSGAAIPMKLAMAAGGVPFALVGAGGLAALAYLLVFNRRTRQSLHDLAVGAFVVRAAADAPRVPGHVRAWRGHVAIAAVLALLAGVFPLWLSARPLPADLLALDLRLSARPELESVGVSEQVSTRFGLAGAGTQRVLLIRATIAAPLDDDVPLSVRLAGIALDTYAAARQQDRISVQLAHGFDIGIAAQWRANELALTPAQWADRVAAGVGG